MRPEDLTRQWETVRARYATTLVDRLSVNAPVGEVAVYALSGGKRLRPLLAELVGRVARAPFPAVTAVAVAVEYLHTASVLLDDLACMDGATQRRGAPPAHVRFSEAGAILASVALQSRAYALLLEAPTARPEINVAMALAACVAVGGSMVTGQALELADAPADAESVHGIHDRKTGSLLALTSRLACRCGEADATLEAQLVAFATQVGSAYQALDDVADRAEPGERRANLARVTGVDRARSRAKAAIEGARANAKVDTTGALDALLDWLEQKADRAA